MTTFFLIIFFAIILHKVFSKKNEEKNWQATNPSTTYASELLEALGKNTSAPEAQQKLLTDLCQYYHQLASKETNHEQKAQIYAELATKLSKSMVLVYGNIQIAILERLHLSTVTAIRYNTDVDLDYVHEELEFLLEQECDNNHDLRHALTGWVYYIYKDILEITAAASNHSSTISILENLSFTTSAISEAHPLHKEWHLLFLELSKTHFSLLKHEVLDENAQLIYQDTLTDIENYQNENPPVNIEKVLHYLPKNTIQDWKFAEKHTMDRKISTTSSKTTQEIWQTQASTIESTNWDNLRTKPAQPPKEHAPQKQKKMNESTSTDNAVRERTINAHPANTSNPIPKQTDVQPPVKPPIGQQISSAPGSTGLKTPAYGQPTTKEQGGDAPTASTAPLGSSPHHSNKKHAGTTGEPATLTTPSHFKIAKENFDTNQGKFTSKGLTGSKPELITSPTTAFPPKAEQLPATSIKPAATQSQEPAEQHSPPKITNQAATKEKTHSLPSGYVPINYKSIDKH